MGNTELFDSDALQKEIENDAELLEQEYNERVMFRLWCNSSLLVYQEQESEQRDE